MAARRAFAQRRAIPGAGCGLSQKEEGRQKNEVTEKYRERSCREVKAGANLAVYMKWQNVGSAPCYRPYRLAYRLSADGGAVRTIPREITVNRWLPGSIELFTDEFLREPPELPPGKIDSMVWDRARVPGDLPAGTYTLSIAVVEPGSVKPAVQPGIKGRAADGWYPLSSLTVLAIQDSTGTQH